MGKRDDILNALKASEIEEKEEKERMRRYNIALHKANKSMDANLALNDMLNELDGHVNEDEDEQFHATLQRANRLKEQAAIKLEEENASVNAMDEDNNENAQGGVICLLDEDNANEDGIAFSIATQFSDGLSGAMNEIIEENESVNVAKDEQLKVIKQEREENDNGDEDVDIAMADSK